MTEPEDAGDWPERSRMALLREMWNQVIVEDHYVDGVPGWIESWFRSHQPGVEPSDPTAAALFRILASGADPDDVTVVVKVMQEEVLYNVCQLIDEPGLLEVDLNEDPDAAEIGWRLLAERTAPPAATAPIGDLHTDFWDADPTGRQGAPRDRGQPAS
jgi:hypothetical protein